MDAGGDLQSPKKQINKNPNAVNLNAFGTRKKKKSGDGWQFLNFQCSIICGSYLQRITILTEFSNASV